jgi:hypothetical protein
LRPRARFLIGSFVPAMTQAIKYILIDFISALLLLLFLYTGLSKLYYHDSFAFVLSRSPFLHSVAKPLSWLLPVTEVFTAGLLFFNSTKLKGLHVSLLLLFLFTVYLIISISSGHDLPCSCGGVISQLSWRQHIWFNAICIVLAAAAIALHKKINSNHTPP